ncbi:hypothetical protein DAT35_55605 [Vitiosangium sp. GDMCC 1.1324]|nr:hypothetical protein DAT35_55605 [Vitiosangium sp. GDMCC 1.1324]
MVVSDGFTVTLDPVTVPTPEEMLRLAAPATSQFSAVLSPRKIVDGTAAKWVIVGGGRGGSVTFTEDSAYLLLSATLVARTVYEPATPGAVYTPSEVMLPPVAIQLTDVSLAPVTVAVKRCVSPVESVTDAGSRLTVTPGVLPSGVPLSGGLTMGSVALSHPSRASRGNISTRELKFRYIGGLQPEWDARKGGVHDTPITLECATAS